MTPLTEWQYFYTLLGAAAGTLTGLQFIVVTLVANIPGHDDELQASEAFATPTIVHFVSVLLLAASMVVPWHSLRPASLVWASGGLAGVVYTTRIIHRMVTQTAYEPVLEDWTFHAALPLIAYGTWSAAALSVVSYQRGSLFTIAAAAMLLLAVSIHNAWDNTTYIVYVRLRRARQHPHD